MSDQAWKLVRQLSGQRRLKVFVVAVVITLTGCFGPRYMRSDIQDYNKAAVASEEEMLLYNIGRLREEQPPHFMMLSTVAQTRSFSASLSFQWSQLWNSLATPSLAKPGTVKESGTFQAGPFTAGEIENPTIQFVPIQGQDFAGRFESTLTDKFTLFLEDRRWSAPADEQTEIVMLFAQSFYLIHGDQSGPCGPSRTVLVNGSNEFSECVKKIVRLKTNYVQIDGSHRVPTTKSISPLGADVVTALQAGYEWKEGPDKFSLTTPVRIPAWFDYTPRFAAPPEKPEASSQVFWVEKQPRWQALQYKLPKGYQWKVYKVNKNHSNSADVYALVPDGYDLARKADGTLKTEKRHYVLAKSEEPKISVGDVDEFTYPNSVVSFLWPVPQNYFYVELRRGEVGGAAAEHVCQPRTDQYDPSNNVICGYLKIGNLLQIMHRLAKMACTAKGDDTYSACPDSFFGIGSKEEIPPWADRWAPYTYQTKARGEETKWVWVPAHPPNTQGQNRPDLATRDRRAFFLLYKLYQMSLVDTSKLVTGALPITIGK